MKKLPLNNLETKNIPVGPRLRKEILKSAKSSSKATVETEDDVASSPLECQYGNPSVHTTAKLKNVIHRVKHQEPNITQMVDDKLASPTTAKYIRRKKASRVTVVESKKVYQDLVSLDVSGSNLIRNLEEELRKKACTMQPHPRTLDPEPSLADYFREEEFVSVRTVGSSTIFPVPVSRRPYSSDQRSLFSYTNVLLG